MTKNYDGASTRKDEARRRLQVLDEDFAGLARALLQRHYKRDDVREGVSRHVSTGRNLMLRVIDEIAAPLYETPPARTLRDAPEEASETLAKLVEVLELDTFMQAAVGPAFACNIVHIVPVMRPDPGRPGRLKPALELVTPDISDAVVEHGELQVLTYDLDTDEDDPRKRMAVDANGWHYLDGSGEIIESIEMALGRCPAVEFRLQAHHRGDYWGGKRGGKLTTATLQIARIAAHMGWVRESLNSKFLALIAPAESLPAEAKVDARRPIHLNTTKDEAAPIVLDLEVHVAGFVAEMRQLAEPVLESYGLPYTAYDLDFGSTADAANVFAPGGAQLYSRRKKIRNRQLPAARRAERTLMHRIALVLNAYGHELALDPDLVFEAYDATWSEMTFADHPLKLIEIQEKKMQHHFMAPEDAMLEWRPELTRAQARALMDAHRESRVRGLQLMAKHNMPSNPGDDGNYVAQIQGRVGQLERDSNTSEGKTNDDAPT